MMKLNRRDFFKTLLGAGAAVALASVPSAEVPEAGLLDAEAEPRYGCYVSTGGAPTVGVGPRLDDGDQCCFPGIEIFITPDDTA